MGLPRRRRGLPAAAVPLACAALLAGCSSGGRGPGPAGGTSSPSPTPSASPPLQYDGTFGNLPTVVARAAPCVVGITAGKSHGYGVIYNEHGLVVTAYHLVKGVHTLRLSFANGSRGTGSLITDYPPADLALVQVHGSNLDLPTARFVGALPAPGYLAAVVTAPDASSPPVAAGVVAAIDRDLPAGAVTSAPLDHLIETDLAVPRTDVGAPVVNYVGHVIGLLEPVPLKGTGTVGYALPSTTVVDVMGQLAHSGRVRIGFLGVSTETLTPQLANGFGPTPTAQPSGPPQPSGVAILAVAPRSPAATAGLVPGEVITAINGSPVDTVTELYGTLDQHVPGDRLTLTVVTPAGVSRQVPVTLAAPPH